MKRSVIVLSLLLCLMAVGACKADGEAKGLIGGIGLTHLTVYEQKPAPDGANSGSPHVHAITDEAYYILSGTGRAELHNLQNGFQTIELKPGQYLQFPPCTLHRIVSTGGLTILAVMGNAGLAEQGDARIYFGKAVDDDPAEYARLVGLAKEKGLEGALERRDAAVRAYQNLLKLWETDKPAYFAELRRFMDVHLKAVEQIKPKFTDAVASGPLQWGMLSQQRLESLPVGKSVPEARFHDCSPKIAYGMCGILRPVLDLKLLNEIRSNDE